MKIQKIKSIFHHKILYLLLAVLWCFFQFTGFFYAMDSTILWTPLTIAGILTKSFISGVLIGLFLYYILEHFTSSYEIPQNGDTISPKVLIWAGIFILLCWLVGFLAYFPGICTYDFSIQMGQIENNLYSDHHPVVHTLLIRFFWSMGCSVFGSGTLGIAFYTVFQALILALSMVYGLYILIKAGKGPKTILFFTILCGLFPAHIFMSISVTKDTLFTVFVFVFLLTLLSLFQNVQETKVKKVDILMLFISTIGIVYFRNNGKYALLAMIATLLLLLWRHKSCRSYYKTVFLCVACGLLIGTISLSGIQSAVNCTQGDRREMLSMPIQQWARIVTLHGEELDAETYEFITQCIAEEGLKQYDPYISDPVKRHTNTSAILNNAKTFIKTYVKLFLQYPGEYVNAVLIQNSGFLYIGDTSHAWINHREDIPGYGYIQTRELADELATRDIFKESKWPWLYEKMESFTNDNQYLNLPLVNLFMAPGIYLAILLFTLGFGISKKRWEILVPYSFLAGYYLTMFLGPTVQLRYIYPVMLATPFMMALYFRISLRKELIP